MLGHSKIMGIYLQMVCNMSYVPLNAENCMQNVKKKSKVYCDISLSLRWKEMLT